MTAKRKLKKANRSKSLDWKRAGRYMGQWLTG
jgi:hypothetical protein